MANAADVLGEPITRTLGGRDIKFEMFNFGLVAEFQRQQKRALTRSGPPKSSGGKRPCLSW